MPEDKGDDLKEGCGCLLIAVAVVILFESSRIIDILAKLVDKIK